MDERDIVERLRAIVDQYGQEPPALQIEAADLITDLREQADNVIGSLRATVNSLRLDLTRAREEINNLNALMLAELAATKAELADAWEIANAQGQGRATLSLALSALRARVVEVGAVAWTERGRALSNLVKEVESRQNTVAEPARQASASQPGEHGPSEAGHGVDPALSGSHGPQLGGSCAPAV